MPASGCAEPKSSGGDVHQQRAVDVFAVPGELAHAVGDRLRPVSDAAATTCPPGHTQKLKALRPLGRWQRQLIGAGRQGGMPRTVPGTAPRRTSACRCSMRTPMAKGFCSMASPASIQHLEGIPGAVAEARSTSLPGGQIVYPRRPAAPLRRTPRRPSRGRSPAARRSGCPPRPRSAPGADCAGRCAAYRCPHGAWRPRGCSSGAPQRDQRLHNEPVAHVTGAGVQLPVGKRPGAALAELDVAARCPARRRSKSAPRPPAAVLPGGLAPVQ